MKVSAPRPKRAFCAVAEQKAFTGTASSVSSRARPGVMSSAARRSEMMGTAVLQHTSATEG